MAYLKEEIKAGVIIVLALLLLSTFSILVGGTQFFEKHDNYVVKVMNAAGLEPGAQVKLGGVRIGRVLDIKAPEAPGARVSITIGLTKGITIYKGTKALITQAGFVGDIYLLLSVEKTINERFHPGDTIPSIDSIDFNRLMARLDVIAESVDRLVNDVDKLFSEHTIQDIERTIKNAGVALSDISSLAENTEKDISQLTRKVTAALDKVADTVVAIQETANAVEDTAGSIGNAAGSINDTARSVGKTSDTVGEAVSLQSQNISDLIIAITEAAENLQEVLQEIKNKPWSILYKEKRTEHE